MHPRICLDQAVQPGHHNGLDEDRRHQVSPAGSMTADQVVLELKEVGLTYLVLGHGTEAGIDPIDQFIRGECTEKIKILLHFLQGGFSQSDLFILKKYLGKIV